MGKLCGRLSGAALLIVSALAMIVAIPAVLFGWVDVTFEEEDG